MFLHCPLHAHIAAQLTLLLAWTVPLASGGGTLEQVLYLCQQLPSSPHLCDLGQRVSVMGNLSVLGVEGSSSAIPGCGVTGIISGAQENMLLSLCPGLPLL